MTTNPGRLGERPDDIDDQDPNHAPEAVDPEDQRIVETMARIIVGQMGPDQGTETEPYFDPSVLNGMTPEGMGQLIARLEQMAENEDDEEIHSINEGLSKGVMARIKALLGQNRFSDHDDDARKHRRNAKKIRKIIDKIKSKQSVPPYVPKTSF